MNSAAITCSLCGETLNADDETITLQREWAAEETMHAGCGESLVNGGSDGDGVIEAALIAAGVWAA